MKSISSQELRNLRNTFRESKHHKSLPEVSLIADKESTAMFNVAGMQQLIPYLMGKPHDLGKRVFNIQRCIRTVDIDEVGDDSHHTFFEMMGNWSLGDYFKKEAVERSREFLTSKEYLAIDPKKLAVTVFQGDEYTLKDEETAVYWKNVGLTQDKISYLSAKHNRWSPGPVWPCGPDTEIFYRIGAEDLPPAGSNVETDEDNWLEIWNNVFMEFYRDESGTLTKLKQQNVDTGMWFERIVKTLQGKKSNYESDLFLPIIQSIEKHTKRKYQDNQRRMRIVADHLRTAIVLIDDGCIASNVGAWYVLRMIIRRMYYNLILLNDDAQGTYEQLYNDCIAFIATQRTLKNSKAIVKALQEELTQFKKTIANGTKILNGKLEEFAANVIENKLEKKNQIMPGKDVFFLYDTCWFPVELTREILAENEIQLDEAGFQKALEEAREKSRQWTKDMFKKGTDRSKYLEGIKPTKFIWYDQIASEKTTLLKDIDVEGQRILIFDQTPFYAESGWQTGDKGKIILDDGTEVEVIDVKKYEGVFLHFVK